MMSLPIDASPDEAFAFANANAQRADANHQRALDNFDNLLPWRWLRMLRENKAIKHEMKVIQQASQESQAWINARYPNG